MRDNHVEVETLARDECLRLMAGASVGRIGLSVRTLPVILPVNFVLLGTSIVIQTVPGTKLDAAARHAVVAFEVDSYAPDGSSGWSVMVQGASAEVTDPAKVAELAALPLRAWVFDDGVARRFVRIEASFVSGRRFRYPRR